MNWLAFVALFSFAAAAVNYNEVKRDEWLQQFEGQTQGKICKSGGYFTTCFEVKESICKQEFTTAYKRCLASEKLPKVLDSLTDGERFGYRLGLCIGVKLEKVWDDRKSNNDKCYARNDRWQ